MKHKDEFSLELSTPIKIQGRIDGKNEFIECSELFFSAPSLRHRKHTFDLKKRFMEAVFGMTSFSRSEAQSQMGGSDSSEEELTAKQIISVLYASKGFDILGFYGKFQSFLVNGVCFTDSEQTNRIKPSDIEKLSEMDFESLISKYIEFFFIASWMKTVKED